MFQQNNVQVSTIFTSFIVLTMFGHSDAQDAQVVPKAGALTLVAGVGEGWIELTGEDFRNVNCHADTWRWEGGHAFCNGQPVGVIRYREPLKNFEFVCEWMHKQKGGNSGIFVWATPQSVYNLTQGQGSLPQGIEVQVLDLGYGELYEKQTGRKGDWFTSHGDIFPVGAVKMRPFPPISPDGSRSFPSAETTKGINEWNHYYLKAIDGEVRLWVNGVEVSGGDGIEPAMGFLCLESEGAPIEFRNLRLKNLSPEKIELPNGLVIPVPDGKAGQPVSLEGHAILGKWTYADGYSREFTSDGWCVLRQGERELWRRKAIAKTAQSVTLEGGLTHEIKGERLSIERIYDAVRMPKF